MPEFTKEEIDLFKVKLSNKGWTVPRVIEDIATIKAGLGLPKGTITPFDIPFNEIPPCIGMTKDIFIHKFGNWGWSWGWLEFLVEWRLQIGK